MRTIVHSRNYLIRYLLCFLGCTLLFFFLPEALGWPVRMGGFFLIFALAVLVYPIRGAEPSPLSWSNILKKLQIIWGWQCVSALVVVCLQLILQRLFTGSTASEGWTQVPFFTAELFAKLVVAATISSLLAHAVYRTKRPLTVAPIFPKGSDSTTRLVIMVNTWIRDACTMTGIVGFSASLLLLVNLWGNHASNHSLAIEFSALITFFMTQLCQTWSRRLCNQYGFLWVLVSFSAIFLLSLSGATRLLNGLPAFSTPSFLAPPLSLTTTSILCQSLSMLILAPLIFRSAAVSQGLSLRTMLIGQCLNPYLILVFLTNVWRPWLLALITTLKASNSAMTFICSFILVCSLIYLGSSWFANLLERLFINEREHYSPRLRSLFNRKLQLQLALWFLIFSLHLSSIAVILITTVAGGSLLAYYNLYFVFWGRVKDYQLSKNRQSLSGNNHD